MQDLNTLKQALAAAEAAFKADCAKLQALKKYDRVVNEGGEGYSSYEAASEASANKHWPIIKAAKNALFVAEWTEEVTTQRRAVWNAEMGRFISAKRNPTTKEILAIQVKLGFTMSDLKKAMGK